jgi:hypothetical protein
MAFPPPTGTRAPIWADMPRVPGSRWMKQPFKHMKISNTEMTTLKTVAPSAEPTHDEIAMCAFLAWEKEGRLPGRETHYWLSAEAELRALRQKKLEAAASRAAKTPLSRVSKVANRAAVKPSAATTKSTSSRSVSVAASKPAPKATRSIALTPAAGGRVRPSAR